MRVGLVILFLSLLSIEVLAQQTAKYGEIFCSNDFSGGEMIRVKWIYNTVYVPEGFDVYRKENGGGDWTKLNSSPIVPVAALPSDNKLDQEAKDLFKAMMDMDFREFAKDPFRVFIMIKAIYVHELAEYIGMAYNDRTAQRGKTYVYKFCVTGTTETVSESQPITCEAYKTAAAPENFQAKRSRKKVELNWKPEIYRFYGVDIYKKKREETTFTKITKTPRAIQKDQAEKYSDKSVYFEDTNIVYTDNYVYKIVAIDYFGQETEVSPEISVPAADYIPPTEPFNVVPTASSVNNSVRIDWQVVEESDLAGVNIYESDSSTGSFRKLNKDVVPKTQQSYMHTEAGVGGHYYYIATVDIAGNESRSGVVFGEVKDITPPAKPSGLTSSSGEGYITLSWNANTEPDLDGYLVQRSLKKESDDNNSYVNVNGKPIKELTYTEKLPKNVRNEFVYRIVAIDTSFNRSKPSDNTLAKMPDVTAPLQPLIKNVVCDTTQAVITWLPNADLDLDGYNIYRRIFGDSLTLEKVNFSVIPSTVAVYTDRGLKAGMSYEYMVEAIDKSDNASEKSKAYFAKTLEAKPDGKITLDEKKFNEKKGTLSLEWSIDTQEQIKGYVIYYQKETAASFKPMSGLIGETHTQVSLGENKEGMFCIKAYTSKGNIIQSENFKLTNE